MGQRQRLRQINAYAMNFGLGFGLWWTVGFVWFVAGYSGVLIFHTLFLLVLLSVPFVGVWLCMRFRNTIEEGGALGFGEAYLFSVLLYLYAALVLTVCMWLYLNFLDGGRLVEVQIATLEGVDETQVPGWTAMKGDLDARVAELGYDSLSDWMRECLTAVGMSANVLCFNCMAGLLLSFVNATVLTIQRRK